MKIYNCSEIILLVAQITDPNSVEIIELLNELSLKGIDYFYNDYLLKVSVAFKPCIPHNVI